MTRLTIQTYTQYANLFLQEKSLINNSGFFFEEGWIINFKVLNGQF